MNPALHCNSCTGPTTYFLRNTCSWINNLWCCPSLKSDAQSATHTVTVSSVAGLVTLDAVTATHITKSASSVAKRKIGSFLVAEEIYFVYSIYNFIIILFYYDEIYHNIMCRSMGPVDETKESFTLDCYFRWTAVCQLLAKLQIDPKNSAAMAKKSGPS
jgi:hypothetical protein